MGRLREVLKGIKEERQQSMSAQLAHARGLEKKPGFGNYGPKGSSIITHRSMGGKLKRVHLHRLGKKPLMTGKPVPPLVIRPQA